MGAQDIALLFYNKIIISLLKNISALSAAQVLSATCNFFSLLLITKMLGPEVQGEWYLYINAFTFGTIALGLGLPPALNHYVAAGKIEKQHLTGQLFLFALIMGLVFFLFIFSVGKTSLSSFVLPQTINKNIVLFGLGVHFFVLIFNQLMASVLLAEKQFVKAATIASSGSVLLLMAYVIFHFLFSNPPTEYFIWLIAANLIVLIVQSALYLFMILGLPAYHFSLRFFSRPSFMLLLGFAAWAYITNFIQFFNYKMDLWFISAYEPDEARLGVYGVAAALAQLIWLIPSAFHSVIFTDVSSENSTNQVKNIWKWSKRIFFYALLASIFGFALSHWLVPHLFGSSYNEVIRIFPLLLPGVVVFAPAILWSAYFAGINRIDVNFKSSLLGFLLCLLLNWLLIPSYSIFGAALASSISYAASAFYLFYLFLKVRRTEASGL